MLPIRALLLLLLLAPLGAAQDPVPEPAPDPAAAARERLEAAGALVQRVAQGSAEWSVNFAIHGKEAGDAALAPLAELTGVVELNLGGTQVSDAGLKSVGRITSLRRLYLHKTRITDAGLAHLAGLAELAYLNLYATGVSDAGLAHLKPLSKLRKLYLWQTQVTAEGEAALAKALPELVIVRELELPEPPPQDPLPEGVVEGSCCAEAHAKGEACAHDCCKEAAAAGKVCVKCNPPEELPKPEPKALPVGIVAGSCCAKAIGKGDACAHPCCKEAAAAGKVCTKCNPPEQLPKPEPKALPVGIVAGSCCAKAIGKGEACAHPCCKEAAAAGKVCVKCNPPEQLPKPEPKALPVGVVAGSCCAKAIEKGEACAHPCCKEATAAGKVCTKCNPPQELPKPEPKALPVGVVAGSCCAKAIEKGEACAHPCCKEAAAAGKVCVKCNPPEELPKPEPKALPVGIVAGSCCAKAIEKGDACAHPCCKEAAAAGKVCVKCNPPEELPKPEPKALPVGIVAGSCCAKAIEKGEACGHPCCKEATAAGKVCTRCNRPR